MLRLEHLSLSIDLMLFFRKIIILLVTSIVAILSVQQSVAQQHKIVLEGDVTDPGNEEKLPFVTLLFSNTAVGTRTDIDGHFAFELERFPSDTLTVRMLGYETKTIIIDTSLKFQKLKIELGRGSTSLKELVVRYDPDPGLSLIKKVIANRDENNYNKAENYKYEVYNKLELDISKIPKKALSKKGPLKAFNFIENYIDSNSGDKPFLPLFLTETISDYYYQNKPKRTKEFIKATRISGYKNESVSQFLGSMYQNINIYDNYIPVFDIDFVSPIASTAPFFYKYSIADTVPIGNGRMFKVLFEPKRSGDHTFRGDIWIHDKDFAVQKVSMQVSGEQQINWVEKINLVQEYEFLESKYWFLVKDKFYVDFIASKAEKAAGFIGRKTTTYEKIEVNNESIKNVINDKAIKEDLIVEKGAADKEETYWNENRHTELSKNELAIYKMIDTIQSLPIYNRYYNALYFLSTGIKEFGPIEFGPIYNSYSTNYVEGNRFRISLGTTPKIFKNAYINGYIAYGTRDKKVKYAGNILWLLNRNPRRFINLNYKHDIDNSLSYYDNNAGSIDNIFNSIGRKSGVPWKLVFIDQKRIEFFNETQNGFSQMLSFEQKRTTPYEPLPINGIFTDREGNASNGVSTTEIGLELKMAYLEKFVEGNYWRTSLGSKYPAIKLYTGLGLKNVLGGDLSYLKVRFSIADNQPLGSAGKLYYNLFAGKIFGTLPYPLLEIHPGNEFYYYNGRTFNMMNRFEYLSDTYVGLITEHSLGSFIFKYIPLLKKTKIRTFWNAKGVYGYLSDNNEQLNFEKGFPFQSLRRSPYLEMGTGLENIFRVLRIDFVWRVLPTSVEDDTPLRRFGVFGSVKFEF